ncbi:MAG: hypothetical protein AMXMBFR13_22750 [Phycisphaerae bacterium]
MSASIWFVAGAALAFSLAAFLFSLIRIGGGGAGGSGAFSQPPRRMGRVMAVAVLVPLIAIPVIWLVVPARYASTAVIKIAPCVAPLLHQTGTGAVGDLAHYERFVNSQVGVIRSPKVMQRVLDRPSIRDTVWHSEEGKQSLRDGLRPDERLSKDLCVAPRPETYYIDVTMRTRQPDDAKLIVDAVVEEYVRFYEETRGEESKSRTGVLEKRKTALEGLIEGRIQMQHNRSKKFGTIDTLRLREELSVQYVKLSDAARTLEMETSALESKLKQLHPAASSSTAPAVGELAVTRQQLEDELVLKRQQLEMVRQEITEQKQLLQQLSEVALQLAQDELEIKRLQAQCHEIKQRIDALHLEELAPARISIASYGLHKSETVGYLREWLSAAALAVPLLAGLWVVLFRR